jgi:uncharacterized protein
MSSLIERVGVLGYLAQNAPAGWVGRTALMKFCYFLQELRGARLGYSFSLYSYGPFDAAVLSDLGEGEALGVLREAVIYYPSGYGYQILCAVDAENLVALGGELLHKYRGDIDWVIGEFGNCSAANLELLSTLVYADREALAAGEEIPMAELSRRVQEVKPRFTNDYILRQAEDLKRKNLLSAVV